jgi:Ribonucleotide reductase, all-alpha domain
MTISPPPLDLSDAFSPSAWEVLRHRYLRKDHSGAVIETPADMFCRVTRAVAAVESHYKGNVAEWEEKFFSLMVTLRFLPNSPTLMNGGLPHGQLAACFVLPIEDSLESIFQAVKDLVLIHQYGTRERETKRQLVPVFRTSRQRYEVSGLSLCGHDKSRRCSPRVDKHQVQRKPKRLGRLVQDFNLHRPPWSGVSSRKEYTIRGNEAEGKRKDKVFCMQPLHTVHEFFIEDVHIDCSFRVAGISILYWGRGF